MEKTGIKKDNLWITLKAGDFYWKEYVDNQESEFGAWWRTQSHMWITCQKLWITGMNLWINNYACFVKYAEVWIKQSEAVEKTCAFIKNNGNACG